MEAFKVIERESKMKAYSKEGLLRETPLTAEERRRCVHTGKGRGRTHWGGAHVQSCSPPPYPPHPPLPE